VLGSLEQEFDSSGRTALFQALKPHLTGEPQAPPYAQIASSLGASVTGIKVSMHRARQRYRELLHAEMRRIVANPADLDDEIRHLLSLLA